MSESFDRLVDIMARLRGEGGCPWDREQTHETLKPYLIEEAYEVLEAIDSDDPDEMCEELGDLLLQVVFHAQLAREAQKFDIENICHGICEKLIRRHPHVFASVDADTPEQVLRNWEQIKKDEKPGETRRSTMSGVPKTMPALLRAGRLQGRAKTVGFDWNDVSGALEKLTEELEEFKDAVGDGDKKMQEEEAGDILFAMVNIFRFLKINAEEALTKTNRKFIRRFEYMESHIESQGKEIGDVSIEDMETLWNRAKREEQ